MQDQINEKTVAMSIKGAKLTGRLLAKAMQAYLRKMQEPHKEKIGKQSLKSLTRDGADLTKVEISGDNIGSFNKIARKFKIGFALSCDDSTNPPNWIVTFKEKAAGKMDLAFKEYTKITLMKNKEKPSLLKKLSKFKELAKQITAPVRNRNRGEREL